MTDPAVLDYLRDIGFNLGRIADALEVLARLAEEDQETRREREEEVATR